MSDDKNIIETIELERYMNDQASRMEMSSLIQTRFTNMQKMLIKTQMLSDKEFQMAYETFESLVDSFQQKKQKKDSPSSSSKEKLNQYITSPAKG